MPSPASFATWFSTMVPGFEPYSYQTRLATSESLPQVMEVPTGAGKTLAVAAAWFYRRFSGDYRDTPNRLVYVLPTRALVEQTAAVFEAASTRLFAAQMLPEHVPVRILMGDQADDDWGTEGDHPCVVVGTQDMVLSRLLNRGFALPRTRWPMAAGALSHDSWFVWDEVQLMANGLTTSIQIAAARETPRYGVFAPSSDLWMSATISSESLRTVDFSPPDPGDKSRWFQLEPTETDGEPLKSVVAARRTIRRARVSSPSARSAPNAYAQELANHVAAVSPHWLNATHPLLLIIVNTVARAQAVHEALAPWAEAKDYELGLLHSRFRGAERSRLSDWIHRQHSGQPRVVVSTQVLEAGVDLDASHLITELAPWSSLVQRMGRLNRRGRLANATAEWIDLSEAVAAPYLPEHTNRARSWLSAHEGATVTPHDLLSQAPPGSDLPTRLVLRRRDLDELFDTTPELAGGDIDVSGFVRDLTESCDVQVFWRPHAAFDNHAPTIWPDPEELCPVSIGRLKELLQARDALAWVRIGDDLAWRTTPAAGIVPGGTYGLSTEVGGYSPVRGFDASEKDSVLPTRNDFTDRRHTQEGDRVSTWCSLEQHGLDTRRHLEELIEGLGPNWSALAPYRQTLLLAATLHDRGKASDVFQQAIINRDQAPAGTNLWAKAPAMARYEVPHFRHELAGALALLEAPPPELADLPAIEQNLVLYLVASHHGRVRLSVRAHPEEVRSGSSNVLGIRDQSSVPAASWSTLRAEATTVSLDPIRLGQSPWGDSWTTRVQSLLDHFGPYRLLALETLLRIADWRASAEEARHA